MIDPKLLRQSPQEVKKNLSRRGYAFKVDNYMKLEEKRKLLQVEYERLQNQKNTISKQIGQDKINGKDIKDLLSKVESCTRNLKTHEKELKKIQSKIEIIEFDLPNLLSEDVPDGKDENDNVEIRRWGDHRKFDFQPLDHVEIGTRLKLLDFDTARKISGSRFTIMSGSLARLHRSLIQFMLDVHIKEHGYEEFYIPYLVQSEALIGTSQLPKFEDDLFKTVDEVPYYLIPTAEVPLTNLGRERIFDTTDIPQKFVAHSPCFRSEAGSYGKDTRGMIRQHQFEKVELVQLVDPKKSNEALESLTNDAEEILKKLNLPYRVVNLCSGDVSFGSSKTYDIEVWLPSQNTYREVSSCSNCTSFQARRMKARWRNPNNKKPELLHTLNGSGVAAGRALIAIMENYQNSNSSISIPDVLIPYMGGDTIIK